MLLRICDAEIPACISAERILRNDFFKVAYLGVSMIVIALY